MNEQISRIYVKNNDIWGNPQTYKGIDFYPLKVKDTLFQEIYYRLLAQPKNFIGDKTILKMSYLKFIIYLLSKEDSDAGEILVKFLEHITRKKVKLESKLVDTKKEIAVENVFIRLLIGDVEFSESEFEDIREIVLEQNGLSVEYVEQFQPDLEKKLAFIGSGSDIDFTDEIFTFSVVMRKSITEIGEYTLYQLQNQMERMFTLKHYELFKPLEVSGQISSKGGEIKPYLYHIGKKGRYDSILISVDKFMSDNAEIFHPNSIK